jgi:hypothetical protein
LSHAKAQRRKERNTEVRMWFKMEWILTGTEQPPDWFIELVKKYVPTTGGNFAAQ